MVKKKDIQKLFLDIDQMSFQAEKWVFVGDFETCPYSKKQVEFCKNNNMNIKGAILCHEDKFSNSDACNKIPHFPSFCNVDTNVCISGLRETKEQFAELQKISDEKLNQT